MALDFDLEHMFWAAAGAAVGAVAGYVLGIVLYIVMLASSAFAPYGSPIITAATNAGVFPMLFALLLAAGGFFGGYYVSSKAAKKAAEVKPAA